MAFLFYYVYELPDRADLDTAQLSTSLLSRARGRGGEAPSFLSTVGRALGAPGVLSRSSRVVGEGRKTW